MLKIFKRKKSMILILSLAVLFSVIMGMLFVRLAAKKSQFNATLGETQLELIERYTQGEKILFYVDQAAKYSINRAVYDLSLNGGFFNYKCGTYKGYGLWQSEKETIEYCSPDYKNSFGKFISTRLDSYLDKEILGVNIPADNYDFVFEEVSKQSFESLANKFDKKKKTKIHGIATIPISINILCGKDKTECGVYKIKPSFTYEINYNLDDYKAIKERLTKISEECKGLIYNEDLTQCVYGKLGQHKGLRWAAIPQETTEEDRNFAFEVTSDKKMLFHDENIVYKFAISIPGEPAPLEIEVIAEEPALPETLEESNDPNDITI